MNFSAQIESDDSLSSLQLALSSLIVLTVVLRDYRHRSIVKLAFRIDQYQSNSCAKRRTIISIESVIIHEHLENRLKPL